MLRRGSTSLLVVGYCVLVVASWLLVIGFWLVIGSLLRCGWCVLDGYVHSSFALGGESMLGLAASMNGEGLIHSPLILSCLSIESRLLPRRERVVDLPLALKAWREESHHPSPFLELSSWFGSFLADKG